MNVSANGKARARARVAATTPRPRLPASLICASPSHDCSYAGRFPSADRLFARVADCALAAAFAGLGSNGVQQNDG